MKIFLIILSLLIGFLFGLFGLYYAYSRTPVYEEVKVVESELEKCVRICRSTIRGSGKDEPKCFELCLDKITCDNKYLLI